MEKATLAKIIKIVTETSIEAVATKNGISVEAAKEAILSCNSGALRQFSAFMETGLKVAGISA